MLRKLLISLALSAITLGLFAPVENYPFVTLDDDLYVTENSAVKGGLSLASVGWAFGHVVAHNWHPLTTLSLMLDATLFGNWPGGFHITSVLLHALNAALLFLLLQSMTGSLWRSALVAALFAWHPLHVEPVAWISSRKDVLSTFFLLLTLLAYVRYARKPRRWIYSLFLVLFACGLMAKPMLVTLPFVLLLLDYWPLGRWQMGQAIAPGSPFQPVPFRDLVAEKTPLMGMSLVFSLIAFRAQGAAITSLKQVPLLVRLLKVPVDYVRYLKKLVWPVDLAVFYPYPATTRLWLVALTALLLLLMTVLVLRAGKRHPYLPVGWFWYLGTLVPVIGIVQIGGQAIADRYTYVPLIGIFIVFAWGAAEAVRWFTKQRWLEVLPGIVSLAGCLAVTQMELKHWESSEALFFSAIKRTPQNWMARNSLGRSLTDQGRIGEAIEQFNVALAIDPGNPDAHNNLANALLQERHMDAAIEHYRMAIKQRPDFAIAHNNLGAALAQSGRVDDAIVEFQTALRIEPGQDGARENLDKAMQLKNQSR